MFLFVKKNEVVVRKGIFLAITIASLLGRKNPPLIGLDISSFDIKLEYVGSPSLQDRELILCDPMLATGSSIVMTYKALMDKGIPKHTHIVCALASIQGIEYVKRNMPSNVTIWAAAIDEELTAQSYIVPGLGDAGDLAFGSKL